MFLHATDAVQLDEVVVRPLGYQWSAPLSVPKLQNPVEPPTSLADESGYASIGLKFAC